jgi:spore germination protein
MYKRMAAILFPIALVAFLGTAVWGYREHQDKNAVLIKAENQYQRAFHELNDHLDQLRDEMGKTLALNSRKQMCTAMTNVWRLAYAAQNDLGQLPLSLVSFDKAENFLVNLGSFAHRVGVRDLNKEPLSNAEYQTLQTLYSRANDVHRDLAQVQHQVLNKNLHWMDVELALATEDKKMDHTIVDGFTQVNKMVEEYPEVDWGPAVNKLEMDKRKKYKSLPGREITVNEAKKKVAYVLGRKSTAGMKATVNSKNGDYQTISVHFPGRNHTEVYADLTKKGGHMVLLIYDRPVKQKKLSLNQTEQMAQRFLERTGYKNMVPITYDEAENIIAFNFVHVENGVYIYPEKVAVKVAMDNGEIVGLQADDYLFNKISPTVKKPKLTEAEARKQVSPRLRVQKSNLAVIYGDNRKPVLCYEFLGMLGKEQYRLFVNAETGDEEKVEKIEKADIDQI